MDVGTVGIWWIRSVWESGTLRIRSRGVVRRPRRCSRGCSVVVGEVVVTFWCVVGPVVLMVQVELVAVRVCVGCSVGRFFGLGWSLVPSCCSHRRR